MALTEKYFDTPAVGYYCMGNFGGLEILAVDGIEKNGEPAVVACFNFGNGRENIRVHTIYYTKAGRAYIRKFGDRYYFDEILRAW